METHDYPFGVVVKDHYIKKTLKDLAEIQSYLLRDKTSDEVRTIIEDVIHHPCTIMLH